MSLKHSYTLLAPLYDTLVSGKLDNERANSLARLGAVDGKQVLINGIGSGLDIPFLPEGAHYTGSDITPAMIALAKQRADTCNFDIELIVADSQALPFTDQQFDIVIMHLILAVVPDPVAALKEAERILKHGGKIYIFDKFLKPGQLAPFRRFFNIFLRHIATRMDVVFEQLLSECHSLTLVNDEPALANGWFRLIELEKSTT